MSLLRDIKGRRPPSNADAVKVYENLSKFPYFRKKYDWNYEVWSENQIKLLHLKVEDVLYKITLDSIVSKYESIDFDIKTSIASAIKAVPCKYLYYYLVDDPFYFLDSFPPPSPFVFEKMSTLLFWNCVVEAVGEQKNFSRIPLDCHIKYINSKSDGTLRKLLYPEQEKRLNKLLKHEKNDWFDLSKKVFATPFQVYRYFIRKTGFGESTGWTEEIDNKLIEAVSRSIGRHLWHEIALSVGYNKTNEQCRLRWSRVLSKKAGVLRNEKKVQEELDILVNIYGKTNWTLVARHLNLTDKQCRSKYLSKVSDDGLGAEKMKEMIQMIADCDWKLEEIKHSLGMSAMICKRKWVRIDPLGYFLYNICSKKNDQNTVIEAILKYIKSMPHRKILLKRVKLLKQKKLSVKKYYQKTDWERMKDGFNMLYYLIGDPIVELQKLILNNSNLPNGSQFDGTLEECLNIIKDMLEQLWPISSTRLLSIINKM